MSPHLTIIAAAMSLGGMASVGLSHHGEVEKQVANYHQEQDAKDQKVKVVEVGERVESALEGVEENLLSQLEKDRENFVAQLAGVQTQVQLLQAKQSSHDVLMERLSKEQTSLEFAVETQAKGFRPLPSLGTRFRPVKSEGDAHPLLPPVSQESSWTNDY